MEWTRLAKRLELAWPESPFDDERRELYGEILRDRSAHSVESAVDELIREDRPRIPAPGEISARAASYGGQSLASGGSRPLPAPPPPRHGLARVEHAAAQGLQTSPSDVPQFLRDVGIVADDSKTPPAKARVAAGEEADGSIALGVGATITAVVGYFLTGTLLGILLGIIGASLGFWHFEKKGKGRGWGVAGMIIGCLAVATGIAVLAGVTSETSGN